METVKEIKNKNGTRTSGSKISYWTDSVEPLQLERLKESLTADVVIVGAGIAGVSIAYCLILAGKKVIVVDDGNVGSGETGRTTGHLVTALDDRYYELERIYGENHIKLVADSHRSAIEFIRETVSRENIDCDFELLDGYLFLHPTDKEESLDKELESARKAGLDVEKLDYIPGLKTKGACLRFSNQAQFHPLKYLNRLSEIIIEKGGRIFTGTHAKEINDKGIVTDFGYRINAKHIVVATNTPVNNKYVMHLKQYAYRTYVISAKIKKNTIVKALWWDTGDHSMPSSMPPYHYVRLQKFNDTHDLLICGGEDHPTGILPEENPLPEKNRYRLLAQWAKKQFDIEKVIYKWSGQVMEPMDSLAYIGRNPVDSDNVYIVTGDSGNGLTHGTIAGMLITDMINRKPNKWEKIYEPSRFKIFSSGKTFFKELAGGMLEYMKHKPDLRVEKILKLKGEGDIVEIDKHKYGVYKDAENMLHIVSAECTHLGCIINWNSSEKSWDCPCHGSRFAYNGKVLNGPANRNLQYHQENSDVFFEEHSDQNN